MIPSVLKNMNAFIDGRGFAGRIESLTPPKLSRKMEEFRAGGMDGAIEIDMGQEKLEAAFTLAEPNKEVLKLYGAVNHGAVPVRFKGAYQRDTDGSIIKVEIFVKGRWKEIDGGEWKPGEKGSTNIAMPCTYYRYNEDGVDLIEIDMVNMIFKVDGVDLMAEMRKALGM